MRLAQGARNRPNNLNMRPRSNPKRAELVTYVSNPRRLVYIRVEPLRGALPPQPGQLTLGELARRRNRSACRLLQVELPLEVRPELTVANSAHRGMPGGEIAATPQPHDLIE